MESPHQIQTNTKIAEVSVLSPEQSKFIKPVDTASLGMFTEGDPDLNTYLSILLGLNKVVQQNKTSWCPTTEIRRNTEDHTPIQTRILKEYHNWKKRKNKPKR